MQGSSKRRSSQGSIKSFHSIDEFKNLSFFDTEAHKRKFPLRATINISLIILTTLQVFFLLSSRIYLRGDLVRNFLSIYIDEETYPNLFDGTQFYLDIANITQLKDHFENLFTRINSIKNDSFVDYFYDDAKFILHTQYKQFAGSEHRKNIHPIDKEIGIIEPFNMSNITDIQIYLIQISQFQLQIQNLTMRQNWQGFSQTYAHDITYTFIDNIKIQINFNFRISNALSSMESNRGEENLSTFRTNYIFRIKLFYSFVLLLALVSLYLNYISIRRTYKILYDQLSRFQFQHENSAANYENQIPSPHALITQQQQDQIRHQVHNWVKTNHMTLSQIKLEHYFHILQFDLIFSTLSNVFAIITALYLVSGIERQRIAGITCLFSWLTIFKFIRQYKKLVLMYELIKLSITKVIKFFVQFLPVFISYALLGMCLFPKVSFFGTLSDSVTTLVCLMMGDSIQMITHAILQKNNVILTIAYIFSFVLMFMHGIHNTLTSLIKDVFIIKKIELVKSEKQRKKEKNFIYIEEIKTKAQEEKQKMPLKISDDLMKGLLRIRALNKTNKYKQALLLFFHEIQNIRITEKWMIEEDNLSRYGKVKEELIRRSVQVNNLLKEINKENMSENKQGLKEQFDSSLLEKEGKKQSLLSGY